MKEMPKGKIVGGGKPMKSHILIFSRIFAQSLPTDKSTKILFGNFANKIEINLVISTLLPI